MLALALACGSEDPASDVVGGDPPAADGVESSGHAAAGPLAPGGTRWVRQLGGLGREYARAVAVPPNGVALVLTVVGGENLYSPQWLGLVWLRPDGTVDAARVHEVAGLEDTWFPSLALGTAGDAFLLVSGACAMGQCPNLGFGPLNDESAIVRVAADGTLDWQVELPGHSWSNVAVAPDGGAAVASRDYLQPTRLHRYRADGTLAWEREVEGDRALALAFGPDGTLAVGAGLELRKLDADGSTLWTRAVAQDATRFPARVTNVGVSRLGTIAFAGGYDAPVSFAGTTLPAPGAPSIFLGAVEPYGAPRFLRGAGILEGRTIWGRSFSFAVSAEGQVAMAFAHADCEWQVRSWGLDGNPRWSRSLVPEACAGYDGVYLGAVAIAPSGDVLVAGGLSGPVDLGLGRVAPRSSYEDGFVAAFAR
jgi:hypothetical protein